MNRSAIWLPIQLELKDNIAMFECQKDHHRLLRFRRFIFPFIVRIIRNEIETLWKTLHLE